VKSFISLQQKRLSDPCHDEIIAQAMPNAQLFKKRCTSDDVPMRWGFNHMEFTHIDAAGAKYLITDFDAPGFGSGIDGQAAFGDSGGGAFILRNGEWRLGGVAYATADGPDADSVSNPAGFGDYTLYTDVYAYRSEITALTGTLVPEPSSMMLGGFGVIALALRRKR
jgi:hypothetical protein